MRAGPLDVRLMLQRKVASYSSSGEPTETWTNLAERWASIAPVIGDERNASEQWVAREQTKFVVRWSAEIDDLSPLDRVIFPSADAGLSPVEMRSIYDIFSVLMQGRNEGIIIMAARRVA